MVRHPLSCLASVVLTSVSVSPRMRGAILVAPLALLVVLGCAARAGAQPARNPAAEVDARCPWGRLANGRGVLVRCLSEGEARRLMAVAPPPADATEAPVAPAGAPSPPPPATESRPVAARAPVGPAAAPSTVPVPVAPSDAGGRSGVPAVPPPGAGVAPAVAPPQAVAAVAAAGDAALTVDIGEPAADAGSLPEAVRSLAKANDRLRECVQKNGGVAGERGEVELRFLVRGRGRAEGVSVKKWKGLTEAAARCVADVVDRRYVGYPEEPIVGVTMTLSFGKKKQ